MLARQLQSGSAAGVNYRPERSIRFRRLFLTAYGRGRSSVYRARHESIRLFEYSSVALLMAAKNFERNRNHGQYGCEQNDEAHNRIAKPAVRVIAQVLLV